MRIAEGEIGHRWIFPSRSSTEDEKIVDGGKGRSAPVEGLRCHVCFWSLSATTDTGYGAFWRFEGK